MKLEKPSPARRKSRRQLLEDGLPKFEQFIESRENYIKGLEKTIQLLEKESDRCDSNSLAMRSSLDELVAMQQLSNTISTATDPEHIASTLNDLTQQILPMIEANIFLFDPSPNRLVPLSFKDGSRLLEEALRQMEAGIVDWVIEEKKTVVLPDLDHLVAEAGTNNFVIVPLILRGKGLGVYVIHTEKPQQDFSNQDVNLLSVLANQAAVAIEHWRTHQALVKANQELKASQSQMMQAAKLAAIGELAAGIAHEIKNPLQVMMLHLEMVQAGRPVPNWAAMFSQQMRRLSEITVRLMDFARNASEEVTMQPVDMNKTIDTIVAMVKHEFEGNGIQFGLMYGQDLPSITGNADYLQQVFLNLLINARDAMPDGGQINIETAMTGFHVCVRLSDTGSGIPKESREKIFEPFFSTKGEKGTGLGLAICSKIVAQHKGDIRMESEEGKGTTFTIFLPIWRGS